MFISDLARQTGVSSAAIRYYEVLGLLPRPQRAANNYRQYTEADVERLRMISSSRSLGFSLNEIGEILQSMEAGLAPCRRVDNMIERRLNEIDQRIGDLRALRQALQGIRCTASSPTEVCDENCVCVRLGNYQPADLASELPGMK